MNDWELIQNYCRDGSESAFETLVKRHVDYVYCAALRQVRDPALAEDVSQAVFLLLARKAKGFRSGTILVSWLFRTTHYIAKRALRSEMRRQRRETEAATMNPTTTTPEADREWEQVSPILDEALAALPNKDRDAVLLRFISQKPFSQVGAEIGVTEDAAKKRVTRALARLREFFVRRGTTLSVASIAVLLGERVVQASPAALATKITGAVGAGTSAAASTAAAALLKTTLRDLYWTRLRWGAVIGTGLVAALWLGTTAVRPARNQAALLAAPAPTVQAHTSVDSNQAVADATNTNATQHTLSLLVVQAEDRKPVRGARVLVESAAEKGIERVLDATTDGDGLLDIPIPTQVFRTLRIWVSAEGRVPMVMHWQGHEFVEPVLSHTLFMEAGQAASGTVLDESGNPVAGAKVSFDGPSGFNLAKRDNRYFNRELSASLTDANGRWATTQLPRGASGVSIRVTSPDYATAIVSVGGLAGFPTNAILVLSNGVELGGRVTAADGTPIANATVSRQNYPYLSTRTDADGRFLWPHIMPGEMDAEVDAEGFDTFHDTIWVTNAVNDFAFTMTAPSNTAPSLIAAARTAIDVPRRHLHGTVVDAETGEPIPYFTVLISLNSNPRGSSGDAMLAEARLLGEGRDGRFDWQVLPDSGGFRLQVEAEGYLASVSEERTDAEANNEYTFKLLRATILTGRVVTADGSPVENAVVTFTGPNMGAVMQRPGQLIEPNAGFEDARTRTDNEGKFQLKLKTGARGIAVIHESGSALLTFAAATNGNIVLQPWGAIDGTLYLNGQPASNQTISVGGTQKAAADPRITFFFGNMTTTDEHGHFRFNQLPPGEYSVERIVGVSDTGASQVSLDQSVQVKVESGAVATVELRRQGRPVVGRIVFEGSSNDVYWGMSTASLEGVKKGYPFALSKDGTMRADDVPPGTYRLSIQLHAAAVNPEILDERTFGSLQKEVVVPTAEDETVPVDLGELTVDRAK